MPIHIERSVDDPIITITFEGELEPETVQEANLQMAQLLTEMGTFYAVVDLRESNITFGEAVALLQNPDTPALGADPRIKFVFLGRPVRNDPTNLMQVPVFVSRDEATEYIRKEIAANAPGN